MNHRDMILPKKISESVPMRVDVPTYPPVIGLHGYAGAGKDTVFERMLELAGDRFVRASFAEPMKRSAAALLDVAVEQLEEWKRDGRVTLAVGKWKQHPVYQSETTFQPIAREMIIRELLQRFGTEAHRDIFGDDFWVDFAMREISDIVPSPGMHRRDPDAPTVVFTDVRFVNEADAIIDRGGQVWLVEGPQDADAAGHSSEQRLPDRMISHVIDNSHRSTFEVASTDPSADVIYSNDYSHLDDEVIRAMHA